MKALEKFRMHFTENLSLVYPNRASKTVLLFVKNFTREPYSILSSMFCASLDQAMDGVMRLALCLPRMSQEPQHFRSSTTQAALQCLLCPPVLSARSRPLAPACARQMITRGFGDGGRSLLHSSLDLQSATAQEDDRCVDFYV